MLDKPCRQPVLSLQQHQSIVHLLPLFDSQPFHKLAKISAKCYNPPFHTANIQKVTISCNFVGKIFYNFNLFIITSFRLDLRRPPDVISGGYMSFSQNCEGIWLIRFLQNADNQRFAKNHRYRCPKIRGYRGYPVFVYI